MILSNIYQGNGKPANEMTWYNRKINTNNSVKELVKKLIKKGGHIDRYYLQECNRSKPALVYLKGWFGGRNIRDAIIKALSN